LSGNLKEEEPPKGKRMAPRINRPAKSQMSAEPSSESLGLGKKLLLLMFLFVIGALLTTIMVIFAMAK